MTGPVLLVNNSCSFGGAELYLEELMRGRPADTEMRMTTRDTAPARLSEVAAAAGVLVTAWRPTPAGLWCLHRELRRAGLVHLNMAWNGDHAHTIALAWLCRRPVIATVHIWVQPRSAWRRQVLRLGYRRFQRVIAVSAEIQGQVVDQLGVRPDAVEVIANGVPYAAPPVRAPRPVVVVGGLGRLVPAKGFDLLIEAVRRLRDRGSPIEAVIAGEGPERASLERAADGLPVRFPGFVTDTRTFFGGVDIFCLPSRWEGLPFALLEAMMAGTPCVAADVGDVAVALGDTGRLVAPGDLDAFVSALEGFVSDAPERAASGRAAHERARDQFGIERCIAQTLAVYAKASAVNRRWRRPRAGGGSAPGGPGAAPRRPSR